MPLREVGETVTVPPFADQRAAGRDLAARLADIRFGSADLRPIVFGVPRGGIPVAFEVYSAPRRNCGQSS